MERFLILVLILSFASAVEYYCDRDRFPLVTDFGPDDCTEDYYVYKEDAVLDCLPGCQKTVTNLLACALSNDPPCPPGYVCVGEEEDMIGECEIDEDSCYKYYTEDGFYSEALWKPECLSDYTWAPKQCKGETANGRCFCFDSTGNRIFGEAFSYNAEDMTCACSRRRNELETSGNNVFVSLHCDSMGNYEPLQCDIDSEQCWCVEPKTGDVVAKIVPMSLMSKLPCYNATTLGSQYLRQCESHLYAQSKITDEFSAHGTTRTNFEILKCQYDGSYGPYKILSSNVYCVWKDNSVLGYQASYDSSIATMNCNCAIDKQIYSLAGLSHILSCQANGNYNEIQMDGVEYFCVDDDGFTKSENSATSPDCSIYA